MGHLTRYDRRLPAVALLLTLMAPLPTRAQTAQFQACNQGATSCWDVNVSQNGPDLTTTITPGPGLSPGDLVSAAGVSFQGITGLSSASGGTDSLHSNWTSLPAMTGAASLAPAGADLRATGTDTKFTLMLAPATGHFTEADVLLGGSGIWFGSGRAMPHAPEPATVALLLPGLLPMGLALRRRRAARVQRSAVAKAAFV